LRGGDVPRNRQNKITRRTLRRYPGGSSAEAERAWRILNNEKK
jgi:hypothetical protein